MIKRFWRLCKVCHGTGKGDPFVHKFCQECGGAGRVKVAMLVEEQLPARQADRRDVIYLDDPPTK